METLFGILEVNVLRLERHELEPVSAGDRSEDVIAKADRYSSELVGPMLRLGDWARAQRTGAAF